MRATWIIAGLMVASGAFADDGVYSRNVVGVIRVTAEGGKFTFLGTPLNKVGGEDTFTLSELLGNDVPGGTSVYVFTEAQKYETFYFDEEDGWDPAQVRSGKGVFVKLPPGTDRTFSFVGEVPSQDKTISLLAGFVALTFPFPVETPIERTDLGTNANSGDSIYEWTGSGYKTYYYDEEDGWDPGIVFTPGKAFFYKTSAPRDIVEVKPYNETES